MNAVAESISATPGVPLWMVAELTYRCPLHCAFCSNPVDFAKIQSELSTEEWFRVLAEARALGAVQLGFTGGEPLSRPDLEQLVAEAHRLGFYTNLITSGVGLNETRMRDLKLAGLDHVQLSFQDSTRELNDFLSSTRTFELKRKVATLIKSQGFPMVMNCVIHRLNIDHVDRIIDLALEIGAEFLELANTQFYGWAELNRAQLLPTREQLQRSEAVVADYRARIGKRLRILHVISDLYENRPKRCMNGWGTTFMVVAPDGLVMPCHAARMLPGINLPSARTLSLKDIWLDSPAFNRFRGDAWMPEPCRSCPEKAKDLGGCRCQAFLLTGDVGATDPVCDKSPQHARVLQIVESAQTARPVVERPLVFRTPDNSERLLAETVHS
ncbi:MAG TPA: pyrroloquinoline quinone biosynthesis protein PqqE [Steroidobacteraceae bacterium]|jgi:pyrroloquinoline quinone biosynthesis protein E